MRSRSMAGHDAPYRPGWDCHGLPIELKVERDLGSKKHTMSPVAFRQECREYAEKYVDASSATSSSGSASWASGRTRT